MVNSDVEKDNNIYYLGNIIKAIVVLQIFFLKKLRFINNGKVMLKKTSVANFWRIVIKTFYVGYNQNIIGIITVKI